MSAISLSPRQEQISGLISCGMAKKEIADCLRISEHTVDNTLRAVYDKTGLGKINELTGWWLTRRFQIAIDFNELKKQIIAMSFLAFICLQMVTNENNVIRARRIRRDDETEYAININDY